MNTRGIIAGLTAALLATTLVGGTSGPAAADADGTLVDRAALAGNPLVPTVRDVPMAVTDHGSTLLTATTAGLTKYALTRRSVKRLGINRTVPTGGPRDLEVLPGGRFAYVTYTAHSSVDLPYVQVFNLRRDRPRLVRTMKFRALAAVYDTALSPDGRLFLGSYDTIKVLDLEHPGHPARAGSIEEPQGAGALAVTPDGARLITARLRKTEPNANPIRVWDITGRGEVTLEREGTVGVPGGEDRKSRVKTLVMSPRGDAIFVESSYCDGECEDSAPYVSRVRFSDLSHEAATERVWSKPPDFLAAIAPDASKVFMRTGFTTDEPETRPRGLSWLDPGLTTHHEVAGVGNVRGVAVSPGGKTAGMLYAAGRKSGKLRVFAVRF
jgi:hypothetical protein